MISEEQNQDQDGHHSTLRDNPEGTFLIIWQPLLCITTPVVAEINCKYNNQANISGNKCFKINGIRYGIPDFTAAAKLKSTFASFYTKSDLVI